jgi:hypothetical protein
MNRRNFLRPGSTALAFLGVVCGMATYWIVVVVAGERLAARRYTAPDVIGATVFLLLLGPPAIVAFIAVVTLATRNKGLHWTCGAGLVVALLSLALVASC